MSVNDELYAVKCTPYSALVH